MGEERWSRGAAGTSWVYGDPAAPIFSRKAGTRYVLSVRVKQIMSRPSANILRSERNGRARRTGFTLIEAMVAISLVAIAASALLLSTSASLQNTDDSLRQTITQDMAQQLMDEVVGCRYVAFGAGPYQTVLCPNAAEAAADGRSYDDIDDFNGFRGQPPTDPYGITLGADDGSGGLRDPAFQCRDGFFDNWRQEIDVYYVNQADPTAPLAAGQTSDYRVVEVRIIYVDPQRGDRELANIKRVVVYVPLLSIN